MATISKFYLHDAATANTGTMPTGAYFNNNDSSGDATGGRTARAADDVIGSLETSSVITAVANTTAQKWGHRRFVSAPLAAHTFTNAEGNWTFSLAAAESNTGHNGVIACAVYVWRPSSGLQVGTAAASMSVALSSTTKTALSAAGAFSGTVTGLDGDIVVVEVLDSFTQSMSTAYTSTFFYDGTTEASATSCASFVTPPAALTLFTSGTTYTKAGHAVESA